MKFLTFNKIKQEDKYKTEEKYMTSYGKESVSVEVCTAETKEEAPFLVLHHASVLLFCCCCGLTKSNSNKLINVSIYLEKYKKAQY